MEDILATKVIDTANGPRNVELCQKDYDELLNTAKITRLNGYPYESYEKSVHFWLLDKFPEFVKKAWEETEGVCIEPMITGATEILWSDRRAKTVVCVVDPKTIVVMENEVKCNDYYAGDYTVLPELTRMAAEVFTLRRGGGWYAKGQPKSRTSVKLVVGYQDHYIDPSF